MNLLTNERARLVFNGLNDGAKALFKNGADDFNEFVQLQYDLYHGNVDGVTPREANDKIVKMYREAIGLDANARPIEVRKAIRRNYNLLMALTEDVLNIELQTGMRDDMFFMNYVDQRNIALGDENNFYVPDNSVLSVSKVSGNHHNLIRQKLGAGQNFAVPTTWYGIKVYAEFERLMTQAEDWATFVRKVTEARLRYIYEAVYASLAELETKLGQAWIGTGELTANSKDELVDLITKVSVASGSEVTIFGVKSDLSKLSAMADIQWMPEIAKEEYYRNGGHVGIWEGARVAEIGNALKAGAGINSATVEYAIPTGRLYIIPTDTANKFIKLVNEGDTLVTSVTDMATNRDMSYEYEVLFKMGIAVVLSSVIGVWKTA